MTISAVPDSEHNFAEWEGDVPSGDGDETKISVTMDERKNITAKFEYDYEFLLDIDTTSGGEINIDPPDDTEQEFEKYYEDGTEVTLRPIPSSDYTFHKWIGDIPHYLDENEKPITVYMEEARDITAEFKKDIPEHELDVEAEGNGEVYINPPGDTFDETTRTYEDGEEVTLSARPDAGYTFNEWEGELSPFYRDEETIDIEIDENHSYTATFEEKTTEYDLKVNTEGGGDIEISPSGETTDGGTISYEGGTRVTLTAEPDSDYRFDEWEGDVPAGDGTDESVTITIDKNKDITAAFVRNVEEIDIVSFESEKSTYNFGDTATTITTVQNSGDSSREVNIEAEIKDSDGAVVNKTVTETIAIGDAANIRSQWDLSELSTTGSIDIVARAKLDSEVVANKSKSDIFELEESVNPVDVTIETETAKGNPVDGARVILTPIEGGNDFSAVSKSGLVEFNSIPPGEYDLTAESTQLNQELDFGLVVDGTSDLTRRITFQPTDAIYGTVFNGAGQQHIPDATVSIPMLQETAKTDAKGEFVFESDIPDATYEFEITVGGDTEIIAESNAQIFNKSREVGIDRTVTFDVSVNLKQPDNDTSELLSEEDQFVSIVVRNLEKRDDLLPLDQQFIAQYGFVKGIITGIQGFLEEIWKLLTNLDDIPKMIQSFIKLIELILDDPSIIFKLVSMMINNILQKQEKDNPFPKGTVNHQTFFGAWMLGYGGIKIVISIVGTKGATKVSKIAKSSSKLNKAVGSFKSKVSDGIPDYSPLKKRVGGCIRTSSTISSSASCPSANYLREIYDYKPSQLKLLKELRDIRRNGGTNYFNDPSFKNALDEFDPKLSRSKNKDYISNARGILIEYTSAKQLQNNLPNAFLKDFKDSTYKPKIVKKLDTDDNDNPTLPQGEARILIPEAESGVEFDNILVGRPPGTNKIKIYQIREATTGNLQDRGLTGDGKPDPKESDTHADKKYEIDKKMKKLENKGVSDESPIYGGIPYRAFKEVDIDNVGKTVATKGDSRGLTAFDYNIRFDKKQMTDTTERILMENNEVRKFTRP